MKKTLLLSLTILFTGLAACNQADVLPEEVVDLPSQASADEGSEPDLRGMARRPAALPEDARPSNVRPLPVAPGVDGSVLSEARSQFSLFVSTNQQLEAIEESLGTPLFEDGPPFEEGVSAIVLIAVDSGVEDPVSVFEGGDGFQFVFSPPREGEKGELLVYRVDDLTRRVRLTARAP